MAGPVIRAVKATRHAQTLTIRDAPPGTSCSVVATLLGSDVCMLVTEPTPFGLHDLTLAVEMVRQIGIPYGVIINRADVGDRGVEDYCRAEQIPILMTLPMDRKIAEAAACGQMLVEIFPAYIARFQQLAAQCQTLRETAAPQDAKRVETWTK